VKAVRKGTGRGPEGEFSLEETGRVRGKGNAGEGEEPLLSSGNPFLRVLLS